MTETAFLALSDVGAMFDAQGKLLPLSEMPEAARRAIAGIEVTERQIGTGDQARTETTRKVKLWDKNSSLDRLAKLHRMLVERSENVNWNANISQKPPEAMTDEELESEAVAMARAILDGAAMNRQRRLTAVKPAIDGAKVADPPAITEGESS